MTSPANTPQPAADTMLAALTVLERLDSGDYPSVDVLMDSIDTRELSIGLVDVARFMASMLANAGQTDSPTVYGHVRSTIHGLVSDGSFGAGSFELPA